MLRSRFFAAWYWAALFFRGEEGEQIVSVIRLDAGVRSSSISLASGVRAAAIEGEAGVRDASVRPDGEGVRS